MYPIVVDRRWFSNEGANATTKEVPARASSARALWRRLGYDVWRWNRFCDFPEPRYINKRRFWDEERLDVYDRQRAKTRTALSMKSPADAAGEAVEKIVETPPPPQVRFDPGWTGQVLSCPRCADAYLHHGKVEVFSRLENDENVSRTTVEGDFSRLDYLPHAVSGNPSPRRDGLRIHFCCEHCGDRLSLCSAQHKGATLIGCTIERVTGEL